MCVCVQESKFKLCVFGCEVSPHIHTGTADSRRFSRTGCFYMRHRVPYTFYFQDVGNEMRQRGGAHTHPHAHPPAHTPTHKLSRDTPACPPAGWLAAHKRIHSNKREM